MTKSEPQRTLSKGESFFLFIMGAMFGVFFCALVVSTIGGGMISTAIKNYSTCLRLGAPEENCRNKYFLLNDR